ncbi:MAG: hypothetical protein RL003_1602, partial [Bacteroidota bacterium]
CFFCHSCLFCVVLLFEPMRGIEPLTFSLPRKRSTPELHRLIPTKANPCFDASGRRGSNPRPTAWKAVALPTELLPHCWYKSVVGASGLEPLNPKERIYSPPQLPLCDAPNKIDSFLLLLRCTFIPGATSRDRTNDLLITSQLLYQLSYGGF